MPQETRGPSEERYRTVARVISVLELLAEDGEALRQSQIASRLALPLSSTHVLLQKLVELQYAEVAADRTYSLGPALVRLGVRVVAQLELAHFARPHMTTLARKTGEDVYLAAADSAGISYIEKVEGTHSPRLNIPLGEPRPLHSTSVGKLYLAMLAPEDLDATLADLRLEATTPHTITDRRILRRQIEEIREQLYSLGNQETVDGIVAIAAPLFDAGAEFVGSLSLSIPQSRFWPRREGLVADLVETSNAVSESIGWTRPAAPSRSAG